ncbi:MAG TPA: HAMP domain-containing sensor histidine kinase [Elusimicrobiota bacterium]|jgi:signal transduction histidine kinase|nr:HAMP domain-containing sensor histidine kinase [Elusimicrobiota bacterium]
MTELKELLDAKTQLMQDVAHELKNPLSVIHGYASFLTKETVPPEEMRKALRAIHCNAERVVAMVEQLQDAVRLESSGFAVETRVVEGAALLQEAAESAELEAARRGIRLRWRSPIGDSLHVVADPKRVIQILANLIGNALKFTPQDGVVDVHAQRDGDAVRFCVIDTGPGIPAEDLPRLFGRFQQARGNEQKQKGLGLGLSICKGLVEAQSGRIWVESLPGAGCAFNFTLPAALIDAGERRPDPR